MAIINTDIKSSELYSKNRFDAEYYVPEFVQCEEIVKNIPNGYRHLKDIAFVTDGDHSTRRYVSSGIKFLTSENIEEFFIDYETDKYISDVYEQTLKRSRAEKGAIYLSKTGKYYGKAAICLSDTPVFNIPADVAKIKVYDEQMVDPFFLVAFLNSKVGYALLRRENSGGTRDRITLVNLGRVPVPLMEDKKSKDLIISYIEKKQETDKLLLRASEILEHELKLNNVDLCEEKSFTTSYTDLIYRHRTDAQHYKPKFKRLVNYIRDNFEHVYLGSIAVYNRRGVQPVYVDNGEIDVIASQHITDTHLKYHEFGKTTLGEFSSHPEAHVFSGDILIYTTGAYVGATNVYLNENKALASNHVNIVRVTKDYDSSYIGFVLNSIIGKFQTEEHQRGSAQAELYPHDIAKFIIPILDKEVVTAQQLTS